MADTTIGCQVCFKNIKEDSLHSVCYDSMELPTLLTFPIKAKLSIDENLPVCNECKLKLVAEHEALMQNENVTLVDDENYLKKFKEETVEVENENEDIVKEECVLFNTDIFTCVDESTASDMLYYCYQCNYATNEKEIFTDHTFTHLFKCSLCSYNTFDNSLLRSHKKVHFNVTSEENVLECHDWGYQCNNKRTLEFPVLAGKKLLNCICIRDKSKNSRRHLFKCSKGKLFSCDICDYRCSTKSGLILHIKTHTKEKPFKCNVCDFCCSGTGNLKIHMYKHSGERPFSCDKCDYRCYTKGALIRHNRTHTKEKPFKCIVCDFCCSESGNLKTHMYKHSGEWPFNRLFD